eukprot:861397-Ditylum_brightwellii.AAC.1
MADSLKCSSSNTSNTLCKNESNQLASSYGTGNISAILVPISTSISLDSSLSSTTRVLRKNESNQPSISSSASIYSASTHNADHHCQYAPFDDADISAKSPSFPKSVCLDSSLSSTSQAPHNNESNQPGISSSA